MSRTAPVPDRRTIDAAAAVIVVALATALLASCGRHAPTNVPTAATAATAASRAPARLADTGLYADFAARTLRPDVLPFTPQYPLWTDGASKQRWIRLPPGTAIDASDPDRWEFPVGTKLWKEFAFERRVETRYLERRPDGSWLYAAYVWTADERDATLAPPRGIPGAWVSPSGDRHDIPGHADCRACHQGGGADVLGFSALQLSPDRDPLAPHAQQPAPGSADLRSLAERGLLANLPADALANPPRIAARSPRERAALGYLHANCGSCHAAKGELTASLGLSLAHSLAERGPIPAAIATTVGRESRFQPHGADPKHPWPRIAAGDPEHSVLRARLAARDPVQQMPPLGTHRVDRDALALLEAWIREDLAAAPPQRTVSQATRTPRQE